MSALVDRITEVLRDHVRVRYVDETPFCECGAEWDINEGHAAHVAERVAAELMSWDFLMALLNEHYPEDVFPTMEDRTERDPGPRIVSLIRYLDAARRSAAGRRE